MPAGKFDKLVLRSDGKLDVHGVFDTDGDVIDEVMVRFVLIPDETPAALSNPIVGTATIGASGLAPLGSAPAIQHAEFEETIDNLFDLRPDAKVRGIGIAVAVKRSDPPVPPSTHQDPPGFETFTWCVNLKVTAETAS
jgi:hypothetical protein